MTYMLLSLAPLAVCDRPDRQPWNLVNTERLAKKAAKGVEQVLPQSNDQRREQDARQK